jgi:hypothetical protein
VREEREGSRGVGVGVGVEKQRDRGGKHATPIPRVRPTHVSRPTCTHCSLSTSCSSTASPRPPPMRAPASRAGGRWLTTCAAAISAQRRTKTCAGGLRLVGG